MVRIKEHPVRVIDVFTPGGFPTITYNPRGEIKLEERVNAVCENLSKILVITGPTKSGKTVLVNRVLPREDAIWIDGGTVSDEDSIWDTILTELGEYNETEESSENYTSDDAQIEASAGVSFGLVKAKLGGSVRSGQGASEAIRKHRLTSKKVVALQKLQSLKIPVVIDDFHYIDKAVQKLVVRAFKAPVMFGVPVVIIAIPNRKYDVIEVEREMTGRIMTIEMPLWQEKELVDIAQKGFSALNIDVPLEFARKLADDAYGSPYLMQEFCKEICSTLKIKEKQETRVKIPNNFSPDSVFHLIADNSGRTMFDKLKRGPRQRSDRKQRLLRNGSSTDIYGVVMEALKALKPGTDVIQYSELRTQIKNVLNEDPPQRHEVTRVLDKIAEISYSDSSSTPVIDWQKNDGLLTITDPFFAFYLKWTND